VSAADAWFGADPPGGWALALGDEEAPRAPHDHQLVPLVHLVQPSGWLVVEGQVGSPPRFPFQCVHCDETVWHSAARAAELGLVRTVQMTAPIV
jgi:hypothetical protein